MEITQDWFIINPNNWFLDSFKSFQDKCNELEKLPIFKIEKQQTSSLSEEMQVKIDTYLENQATDSADDYFLDFKSSNYDLANAWDEAWESARQELIDNFDDMDAGCEFIEINKEDEPREWQKQKELILNYLEKL